MFASVIFGRLSRVCAIVLFAASLIPTASSSNAQGQQQLQRNDFVDDLLIRIRNLTEGPGAAEFAPSSARGMSRDRILTELIRGEQIEYAALATKPEWEEKLITIRIPLRKGLQGYRLFLIDKSNQDRLSKVKTLDDLRKFATGSGLQWSTNRVMEDAGFKVVKGETRDHLFSMLFLNRFQTFARGVDEAFREHKIWSEQYPDLAIEESLALFIPLPTYFFVTPKRPDLAKRLETGLRKMIADGSFDEIFWQHFHDDIERANLDERIIFELTNPNLGPETPLNEPELWFKPGTSSNMLQ